MESDDRRCCLCGSEKDLTVHHLVPQVKVKNRYRKLKNDDCNKIVLCRQCHSQVHALHGENELRDRYNTLESLMSDEKLMKFVEWRKKHPDFGGSSKMSNDRKKRR